LSGNGNHGVINGATWSTEMPSLTTTIIQQGQLSGIAWQADPDNSLNGFTPGNPLSFRYFARRDNVATIYEASHITL